MYLVPIVIRSQQISHDGHRSVRSVEVNSLVWLFHYNHKICPELNEIRIDYRQRWIILMERGCIISKTGFN